MEKSQKKYKTFGSFTIYIIIIIIIIIKALSQLCWSRLHEFCFSIPIYLEPNPHISYTSSYLFLLPPSASSLAYLFSLRSGQPLWRNFSSLAFRPAFVGHFQTISNKSLLIYHLLMLPQFISVFSSLLHSFFACVVF